MKRILTIASSIILMTGMLAAANHYIRQGATGNGSDWTNALGQLPDKQVRGDTYYIADGTYPGMTASGRHSGTTRIVIKKATPQDHGTDTGWDDAMGDGYAKFSGATIEYGYITIDGVTGGGPGSWDSGHGFWFHGSNRQVVYIREPSFSNAQLPGIEIRHAKFTTEASIGTIHGIRPNQTAVIAPKYEYLYFKDMWGNPFQNAGDKGVMIRYNLIDRMHKYGSQHLEAIQQSSDNVSGTIVAYNIWKDCRGTGVLMLHGTGHKVYGNIFMWSENLGTTINNGVIGTTSDGVASNVQIHNNTFIDMPVTFYSTGTHAGHTAKNNIFVNTYDNRNVGIKEVNWGSVAHTHNYYFQAGTHNEGGSQEQATSHPFVKYSEFGGLTNDLHLAEATSAGYTLAAEFNTDPEGLTRGADGVWDRGAYEYTNTGVSWQLAEGSWQAPALPSLIYNCKLQTANCQLFSIQGQRVNDISRSGIYLVLMGDKLGKVTRVK